MFSISIGLRITSLAMLSLAAFIGGGGTTYVYLTDASGNQLTDETGNLLYTQTV